MKRSQEIIRSTGGRIMLILLFSLFTSFTIFHKTEFVLDYGDSHILYRHDPLNIQKNNRPDPKLEIQPVTEPKKKPVGQLSPETKDYYFEIDEHEEEEPVIEDWMLDEYYYDDFEEEVPKIEDWMLDEYYYDDFEEEVPKIEDWMLGNNIYDVIEIITAFDCLTGIGWDPFLNYKN